MATKKLSRRERLEACLGGGQLDRIPVALWRHFPVDDQSPEALALAVVNYQNIYDFDFIKVTPASSYCVKDWGAQDEWYGSTEGTRGYTRFVIQHPEDWLRLPVLDPKVGSLGGQLRCLDMVVKEVGSEVPVVQTIFSPLSQAKNLVSREQLLVHLRRYPDAVLQGLKTISESTKSFIGAAKMTGISGFFYAVQHAQYGLLSEEEYIRFGRSWDLEILELARDLWLNILHLHGEDVMFDLFTDYPVGVINWHDQDTPPTLGEGQTRFRGALCGGLQRDKTMVMGTPAQVAEEAQRAFLATGGKRFILGTGCVVPITAPHGNLRAARFCVEKFKF
jgi:uroporphyrinogen decarboxylase